MPKVITQPLITALNGERSRLVRLRYLRSARGWSWRRSRVAARAFLEQVENAATAATQRRCDRRGTRGFLGRRTAGMDDRGGFALETRDPRQQQAGDEEAGGQKCRGARQNIRGAAAGHETAGRADQTPTLGLLQQHDADQAEDQHEVDDDN